MHSGFDGQKLQLRFRELPKLLEVVGENGEYEIYFIKPAGRKFGASLSKVDEPLRQQLLSMKGKKSR